MSLSALAASLRVAVRNRAQLRLDGSCVVYWMQRAQRGHDNPAARRIDARAYLALQLEAP
jgi:hypothetical protein